MKAYDDSFNKGAQNTSSSSPSTFSFDRTQPHGEFFGRGGMMQGESEFGEDELCVQKPLRVLGLEDGSIEDGSREGKEIVLVEECCSPRFWTEGEEGQSEEEDQWNGGCLARFSKFMGLPINGYGDEK